MSQRGVSLVELLMAAVVASSAGALLVGSLIGANRAADLRREQAVAAHLLAGRLALLEETVRPGQPTEGVFPEPFEGWRWFLERRASPWAPLVEIRLAVARQERTYDAVTYRSSAAP